MSMISGVSWGEAWRSREIGTCGSHQVGFPGEELPGARGDTGIGRTARRMGLSDRVLADFCGRLSVCRLSLFGSTLTGDGRPDSDVDLLVEFDAGREPGLLRLAEMEIEPVGAWGGAAGGSSHAAGSLALLSR